MGSVSVVVCTHTDRRLGLLRECVDSLFAAEPAPHEVIVVVDDNPGLLARLPALLPADTKLLASTGKGVSAARNTGVEHASGELVAFIDDDAVADPKWLAEIARPFEKPDTVAAGGRIVPRWEAGNPRLPDELFWVVGCTYAGHPTTPQPVTRPIACNMAARRDALRAVGGFPHDFGPSGPSAKNHSNEEIALAVALRRRFGPESIWYAPDALVHHFVPASRVGWRYLWTRCVAEGISKADVHVRYGPAAMGFDQSYARHTLIPAIVRYARQGVVKRDRAAGVRALVGAGGLLVTAGAYGGRFVASGLRPAST
ncbi:glycosyltransferase family 2 protein [Virgisporangium aliadipatigenens]|uniref:glycosyltransferase family 2 protein n=1 Tax=Virgisporangium aliadipatigenens TaxID=741659 RepID=UPI001940FDE7|nr:glycosyltransferase family 2 protein [Virgisporangium aliadipatigenens]